MQHHTRDKTDTTRLRPLVWGLIITLVFSIVEAAGGWLSGSLALLGDAGHMLTDALALALSLVAALLARRPRSWELSFGWGRAEVLAALANTIVMILVVIGIGYSAIDRLGDPQPVNSTVVIVIATIGLMANLAVIRLLHSGEQTLNIRSALLHVMGDMLASLAALAAGIIIHFTGWTPIDPLLSVFICILILISSLRLLREAVDVLMERVPRQLSLPVVGRAMAEVAGVRSIHDLHIWRLDASVISLSAHVVVDDLQIWPEILKRLQLLLNERFAIDHITLQPEPLRFLSTPIIDRITQTKN